MHPLAFVLWRDASGAYRFTEQNVLKRFESKRPEDFDLETTAEVILVLQQHSALGTWLKGERKY